MTQPSSELAAKFERERRLAWQSRLLVALVLAVCLAALIKGAAQWQTLATAWGLAMCAGFGLVVWALRAATPFAALTGFVLTACMYLGTVDQPRGSWRHTALLTGLMLFVLAFAATRFRRSQKEQIGVAESRRGRRASQVAANMGTAAIAALPAAWVVAGSFSSGTRTTPLLVASLVAATAEAAADTVSSEIGQALGGEPFLVTSWQRVPPGADGGVSLPGTLAGCAAAAIVVLVAAPTLRLGVRQTAVAWTAAIAGLFADSILGATAERRGWLNNDLVNFLSTGIAALAAFLWLRFS